MSTEFPLLFIKEGEGRYRSVDNDPAWIAKLTYCIDNGYQFSDLLGPLLVRRGKGNAVFYYPVPFLFKSEADRRQAALARGKKPPPDWWVRRKQNLLHRLVGRETKLVA